MTLSVAARLCLTSLSQYILRVIATVKMTEASQKPLVSFTECLENTDWCKCMKCMPMPSGRKGQCCRIQECLTGHNNEQQPFNYFDICSQALPARSLLPVHPLDLQYVQLPWPSVSITNTVYRMSV